MASEIKASLLRGLHETIGDCVAGFSKDHAAVLTPMGITLDSVEELCELILDMDCPESILMDRDVAVPMWVALRKACK